MHVETKDEENEVSKFLGSHPAVVAGFFVELSAATLEASVANSGGSCTINEGLCEQHTSVVDSNSIDSLNIDHSL